MRLVAVMSLLVFSTSAAADYSYEIEQAQRDCRLESGSSMRNGATPSCEKVKELIKLQRLETEAEVSRETRQPMPSHNETNININNNRYKIPPQRIYDQNKRRWCTIYYGGETVICD